MPAHLPYIIRHATERDTHQLWQLMRDSAAFARRLDYFHITEEMVRSQGFLKENPDFQAFVAENIYTKQLGAMAVYHLIPFTAAARPVLFIKDFYVQEPLRDKGLGKGLMDALRQEARRNHCGTIEWQVPAWNKAAIRFYERQGAQLAKEYLTFQINVD